MVSFYAATLFLSAIPTHTTYLPVQFLSVFVIISFLYCMLYQSWRQLSLLVHRLSISIYISVHTSSLIPIPTSLFYSNQFPSSFSYMVFSSVLPFPIYLFLNMCSGVFHILSSYINFPILTFTLVHPNFTKKTHKNSHSFWLFR